MISICIPVYNFYVTELVENLSKQAATEKIDIEILVVDDASEEPYKQQNKKIENIQGVRYIQLTCNIGRSKIRNLLAREASFEYLLFMDCDAKAPTFFLRNYIKSIQPGYVIIGGVSYSKVKPENKFILRWRYGIKRESPKAIERNKNPYHSFKTFNFLIPKIVFKIAQFDEKILGYGHEDTLFGIELKKRKIPILHIDNPLIHLGLESNKCFLEKTRTGIQNLRQLSLAHDIPDEFIESISLIRVFKKMPNWSKRIIELKFYLFKHLLQYLLEKGKAPILLFDLYKLGYLCSLRNHKK